MSLSKQRMFETHDKCELCRSYRLLALGAAAVLALIWLAEIIVVRSGLAAG